MRHFILPRAVAARSLRMFNPATMARLVAPPRCMQRPPARVRPTISAVDLAPIAMAADDRLGTTVWVRAQKQPGSRQTSVVATATLVMRPPMTWTRAVATAMLPLQSCLCTVWGTAPKQNCHVMDRRRACLPNPGRSIASPSNIPRPDTRPEHHPGLPRWVHRNPPPLRCAARKRALRFGAGPSYGLPGQSGAPKRGTVI
jgi:hypothetical protein